MTSLVNAPSVRPALYMVECPPSKKSVSSCLAEGHDNAVGVTAWSTHRDLKRPCTAFLRGGRALLPHADFGAHGQGYAHVGSQTVTRSYGEAPAVCKRSDHHTVNVHFPSPVVRPLHPAARDQYSVEVVLPGLTFPVWQTDPTPSRSSSNICPAVKPGITITLHVDAERDCGRSSSADQRS